MGVRKSVDNFSIVATPANFHVIPTFDTKLLRVKSPVEGVILTADIIVQNHVRRLVESVNFL